jgi:hypothetical protein
MGAAFDVVRTTAPREAIALAERAAMAGARAVVAVGGDGTVNEVLNGLVRAHVNGGPIGTLAVIPAGSGNDFDYMFGTDGVESACRRPGLQGIEPAQPVDLPFGGNPQIEFLHKGLVGREWQEAILSVDALIMPYAAERFRHQPSAMLYTAIGYHKPVVVADNMHPGIFARYEIGVQFAAGDNAALQAALKKFVSTYEEKYPVYRRELARINADFGPGKLVEDLVGLAKE